MALDSAHQNPPKPPGVRIWKGKVPPAITKWAVEVINSPSEYPMHSENAQFLDGKFVMIRPEWHDWSTKGQHGKSGNPNEKISGLFRGATLYEVYDWNAYGEHVYKSHPEQFDMSVSGESTMRRYIGDSPVVKKPVTVTGQAAGLLDLAAKPVRWTFNTAGTAVKWVGGTLQAIASKL